MKVILSFYKKIFQSPTISDIYILIDEYASYSYDLSKMDFTQFGNFLESDLSLSIMYFSVVSAVHNYKIISSDLSRIFHEELSRKMAIKLCELKTNDAFNDVMKLLNDLVTYSEDPSNDNFKTILQRLKVEVNVIRRFGVIHDAYKNAKLESLQLNLGYTKDEVL
jgi:hypothetical protein